jgi:hypothetical protein
LILDNQGRNRQNSGDVIATHSQDRGGSKVVEGSYVRGEVERKGSASSNSSFNENSENYRSRGRKASLDPSRGPVSPYHESPSMHTRQPISRESATRSRNPSQDAPRAYYANSDWNMAEHNSQSSYSSNPNQRGTQEYRQPSSRKGSVENPEHQSRQSERDRKASLDGSSDYITRTRQNSQQGPSISTRQQSLSNTNASRSRKSPKPVSMRDSSVEEEELFSPERGSEYRSSKHFV